MPAAPEVVAGGAVAGLLYVRVGAALSRPVTPSVLAATDAGSETARSLARSRYWPALTLAVDR